MKASYTGTVSIDAHTSVDTRDPSYRTADFTGSWNDSFFFMHICSLTQFSTLEIKSYSKNVQ